MKCTSEPSLPLWRIGLCSGGPRTRAFDRKPEESPEEVLLASFDISWSSFIIGECVLNKCHWYPHTKQVFFVQEEYLET